MWWTVLSLSPHNLHLLFCCVLTIFTLIRPSGVVLCCYFSDFLYCPFLERFRVSYKQNCLFPLMRFLLQNLLSISFLVCLKYSFLKLFPSSPLVWLFSLLIFPNTYNFPFLWAFWYLIWQFCSFRYLSFSTFHYFHCTWFYTKIYFYILIICMKVSNSFSFFDFLQTIWFHPCTEGEESFLIIL